MGDHPAPDCAAHARRSAPHDRHPRGPQHLLYQGRTGCQGELLPHDLLPKSTVWDYFPQCRDDGTWQRIIDALRPKAREAAGREPTPRVGSIDSQTIQGTEVGGERGFDGGKLVRGRKRHLLFDSLGRLRRLAPDETRKPFPFMYRKSQAA